MLAKLNSSVPGLYLPRLYLPKLYPSRLYLVVFILVVQGGCVSTTGSIDAYSSEQLARFSSSEVNQTISTNGDPYLKFPDRTDPRLRVPEAAVCGVKVLQENPLRYSLASYSSVAEASISGADVTHFSSCGTCSTLKDLAVYLRLPNLTVPVRRCAALSLIKPLAMQCLKNIGFSNACAETWYFNAKHTRKNCAAVCLKSWLAGEPFNNKAGDLNACLTCDEEYSGPVFKFSAGRTRRNSGITSAIQRGAEEQSNLQHNY